MRMCIAPWLLRRTPSKTSFSLRCWEATRRWCQKLQSCISLGSEWEAEISQMLVYSLLREDARISLTLERNSTFTSQANLYVSTGPLLQLVCEVLIQCLERRWYSRSDKVVILAIFNFHSSDLTLMHSKCMHYI